MVYPFFFQSDSPLDHIRHLVLSRAETLLAEYSARQPLIKMEARLDLRDPYQVKAWEDICRANELGKTSFNCFHLLSGDGKLRIVLTPEDLAIFDHPRDPHEKAQVHEFRAQAAFTEAVARFTSRAPKKVYVLVDHREAVPGDTGPEGLSVLAEKLGAFGFQLSPLSFRGEGAVPSDCDALLVVTPESRFDPDDRRRIRDYLVGGGRLFAALGAAETGLEEVLGDWGFRLPTGKVYQRWVLGPREAWIPRIEAAGPRSFNPTHPVTEAFGRKEVNASVELLDPRAIGFRDANGLHGEYLLRTTESQPAFVDSNRNQRQDEDEPIGQVTVAGAVWRPWPSRPPPDYRHVDTRIVLLGDGTPLKNQALLQRNHRDFVLAALNWLTGREERVVPDTTAWKERTLSLSPAIARVLFWAPVFLFPAMAISFGCLVYFLRRA